MWKLRLVADEQAQAPSCEVLQPGIPSHQPQITQNPLGLEDAIGSLHLPHGGRNAEANVKGRLVEAGPRWGREARVGAGHLQADQPAAKPAVHRCGYNVLITTSTPQPLLCHF